MGFHGFLTLALLSLLHPTIQAPTENLRDFVEKRASSNGNAIALSAKPENASSPLLEGYVSYSIEFAFFPDYAGNTHSPNLFSYNLISNLRDIQGAPPYIRVGGNTQDYALYNASLAVATEGTYTAASSDYPTILYIGPSYFESYYTWPGVKFIHGFNLAKNTSEDHQLLLDTVPLVCKALEKSSGFFHWELGNEPDLYKTSAQGIVRPSTWNEADYVAEWLNLTRAIHTTLGQSCPSLYPSSEYTYYAPSFAGTSNSLNPITTWHDGLDTDNDIAFISSHNYISGANVAGVTLQGTLMNHSSTVASISHQLSEAALLASYNIPFILGETNSLYNEGRPGLSNSFGAALWGVDFNLWCATNNIMRVHMHQGTDYRYASWQPISTNDTSIGTKPPYYGNIAVANFLGNTGSKPTQIANLPLPNDEEAAYAAFENDALRRVMVVNMQEYNYSLNTVRPVATYAFNGPEECAGWATVQRLMANGSDAITGVTWNGISYNYELAMGRPVPLYNVTRDEIIEVGKDGSFLWTCRGAVRRWWC